MALRGLCAGTFHFARERVLAALQYSSLVCSPENERTGEDHLERPWGESVKI